MRGHRLKAVGSIYWAGRCRNWTKTKNPAFKRVWFPPSAKGRRARPIAVTGSEGADSTLCCPSKSAPQTGGKGEEADFRLKVSLPHDRPSEPKLRTRQFGPKPIFEAAARVSRTRV